MKILFLHLSDIHLEKKEYDKLQLFKSIDFFNEEQFSQVDYITLLFTGDLTQRGDIEQFKMVNNLIHYLKKEITKYFPAVSINILAVPGNHDVFFQEGIDGRKANYENDLNKEDYNEENNKLINYFNFCKSNNMKIVKGIEKYLVKYSDDFSIEFLLINSAIFSGFNQQDYGKHKLTNNDILKFYSKNNSNCSIALMHHFINWFEPDTKNLLNDALKSRCQILFVGHDHNFSMAKESDSFGISTLTVHGGALHERNNKESYFNIAILDTQNALFKVYNLTWNQRNKIYVSKLIQTSLIDLTKGHKDFILTDEKRKYINNLLVNKDLSIDSVYIFPDMVITFKDDKNNVSEKLISTFDSFYEEILKYNIIDVSGDQFGGITSLGKYIFKHYYYKTDIVPLFLDALELSKSSILKWEKNGVEDYYGECCIEKYKQLSKQQKLLIIDNFHFINKKVANDVLNYFQEKYEKILLLNKETISSNLAEEVITNLENENSFINVKILSLRKRKRRQLIYNACKVENPTLDEALVYDKVNDIDNYLDIETSFIKFNPELVTNLTIRYLNCRDRSKVDVFKDVFISSIVEKVKNGFSDIEDVDLGMIILSRLAYESYTRREYPFMRSLIDEVISDYQKEYGGNFDFDKIYDLLLKTSIIRKMRDNKVSFMSVNHFAYFIAREIQRLKGENSDDKMLDSIIMNACQGINGDILLYFALLENNANFGIELCKKSISNLDDIPELTINDLKQLLNFDVSVKPILDEKENEKRQLSSDEKIEREEEIEIENIQNVNFFEDELDPEDIKVYNALTYLNLNCKIISNFYRRLKIEQKKVFIKEIYSQPNKILNLILFSLLDSYKIERDEVVNFLSEKMGWTTQKSQKFYDDLYIWVTLKTIIDLYETTVTISNSRQNIDDLIDFDCENNDLKEVLKLIFTEKKKDKQKFYNALIKMYKEKNNKLIRSLIIKIFNEYIVSNKVRITYKEQAVIKALKLNSTNFIDNR